MPLHIVFQVWLSLLAVVAAQFMPQQMAQMPHGQFPFFPGQGQAIQLPVPNGLPGPLPLGMMPNMPHLPGMQQQMPMPAMQMPLNGGRIPMVVMPHYTKKNEKRRKETRKTRRRSRKRIKPVSASDDDSCSSEEPEFRTKNDVRISKKKRQEVLTPVVSYVTKDGYVIYQKKIKKEKAKDWLELSKDQDHSDEFLEKVSRGKKHHDH